MKHDEDELLNKANDFQHDYSIDNHAHEAIRIYMSEYAEYQDRWRVIADGDIPEDKQFVTTLWYSDGQPCLDQTEWHYSMKGVIEKWKPITLPESST